MSRSFNGGTAADAITFSPGSAPPDEGPITIAVLAKAANLAGFTGWLVQGRNGSTGVWAELTSSLKLFMEGDFTAGNTGLTTSWAWYVATKAAGSSVPRWHVGTLSGGSISWSHADAGGTVPDGSGPITNILLGGNGNAAQTWRGSIAAAATWTSVLNDAAVEAACTLAAANLLAATPGWMVRLNQTSTATSVSDDTGNGGNQTALSGTAIDADDPPSFNYALTSSGVTPTGLAIPIAFGSPTVALGITARPDALTLPIVFGSPTVTTPARPAPEPTEAGGGSWWGLAGMLQEARERRREDADAIPVACPNDGEPLQTSVDGVLYCPYDGWQWHGGVIPS